MDDDLHSHQPFTNDHEHDIHHSHEPKVVVHQGHIHTAVRTQERRKLLAVIILTGAMMVAEFIAGFLTNSLALLSDAFHMLTHLFATAVSFFAIMLAVMKAPPEKTFRYWRIEILASLFNGVCLIPMASYILYEAFVRYFAPQQIKEIPMLVVALIGLVVNIVCAIILAKESHGDLNIKSIFLHCLADSLASVGVIAAGVIIYFTKWSVADPLVAGIISAITIYWAVTLIKGSAIIFLESAPPHIKIDSVALSLKELPEIADVHDIHSWVITSRFYALTAHIILKSDLAVSKTDEIAERINKILDNHFGINHTCLQFEYKGR